MGYWKIITPYATTNLITNPSFEIHATTGWALDGTNTGELASAGDIATERTNVKFGGDSWRILYVDDLDLARYTITLPSSQQYTFSCWVYLNDGTDGKAWDGGAVRLNVENFTSSTINTATTTCSTNGVWTRLQITFTPDSGDLTGDLVIEAASAPTSNDGRYVYIDAAQCEAGAYATTYCDGDQPGCEWTGRNYASTSTRPVTTRAGGLIQDLEDDFGFTIEKIVGTGLSDIKNLTQEHLFSPGSAYQGFTIKEHKFTLVSRIVGTSMSDYHAKRQALLLALTPDKMPEEDSVILRYTGAAEPKEIRCRYSSGLEMANTKGYSEVIAIEFIATEQPHFTEIGNHARKLEFYTNTGGDNHDGVVEFNNGEWGYMSHTTGETGVYCMAISPYNNYLYIGGTFTNWNGNANSDYIACWDGSSWSALGTGMNGAVYAMDLFPNGDLIIGGAFTTAGGASHPGLVRWDVSGSAFATIGSPSSGGTVRAIAVHPWLQDIYIGGSFTNWNGNANADGLAKYVNATATWAPLGTGIAGGTATVYALDCDDSGGLYIGGDFTTLNGSACDSLGYMSGSTFTSLSSSTNGVVYVIYVDDDGLVYIGGDFTTIGAESGHDMIVVWNGSQFSDLGDGPNTTGVYGIARWRDMLIVVGGYIGCGGLGQGTSSVPVYATYWNGSSWLWHDGYRAAASRCIAVRNDDVYYHGGNFTSQSMMRKNNSVTVGGTARVYPKLIHHVTEAGVGSSLNLLTHFWNETTNKICAFDYPIRLEEKLTIDFFPDNINAVSSWRGNVWPFLPGSHLADMYLLPGQSNILSCSVRYSGAPTDLSWVEWKEAYWSID